MLPKTFTQPEPSPTSARPRGWQTYLTKLVAFVMLLGGLGISQRAWGQTVGITDDVITLTTQPTGSSATSGQNFTGSDNNGLYNNPTPLGQSSDPSVAVPQLGTYDLNSTSAITITGTQLQGIINSSATTIPATRLQYRVYLSGTADNQKPSYSNLTLSSAQTGNSTGSIVTGSSSTLNANVLSGLTSGGTYVLDIRFQVDATRNGSTKTFSDLSSGDYFYANFYVTPPTVTPTGGTTTWQGVARGNQNGTAVALPSDTDWANPANWSNGVPTATSNAIIPAKTNSTLTYPILNDPNYNYSVLNLTLQGNSGSSAASLTINAATLTVYGNLSQVAGGLTGNIVGTSGKTDSQKNSTIVFAGADQVITGNLVVSDVIIAGSGTKSVINQLTPTNILAFRPTSVSDGVIVQSAAQDNTNGTISTVFDTTGNSYIELGAAAQISTVSGEAETLTSYVKGVLRANRALTTNTFNSFGNIGLDITPNHNPGQIYVYRVVGDALTGPVNRNAVPVKRQFKIVGDDDSNSSGTANSTVNVRFHYLPSTSPDGGELNGIDENNLTMFSTVTNGAPYTPVGGTLYTDQRIVERNNLPSLTNYTLTLGDKTNPLPVSLVAFGATRVGATAQLTWTTASEENNSGFNVQVSADGVAFRTLGFVASQSPNSSNALNYKYTDTEAGKVGTRYYRLEQVDQDGKKNYSPVRVLNFSGATAGTGALVAYPNPFTDGVSLSLDGGNLADGIANVKLVDMTGRTVRESNLPLAGSSLMLSDLNGLRSGLYLAKVTLPNGTTQTVRISKQ